MNLVKLIPYLILAHFAGCLNLGCTASLDAKQVSMQTELHDTVKSLTIAGRTFNIAFDKLADQKHNLQRKVVDDNFAAFLSRHDDGHGGLVSKDDKGITVPMPATQLMLALADRDKNLAAVVESKTAYASASSEWKSVLDKTDAVNDLVLEEELNVQQARSDLRALGNQAMSAAMGALASFGIGAVVP